MNELPNEILIEILKKCTNVRATEVCKKWKVLMEHKRVFSKFKYIENSRNQKNFGLMKKSKRQFRELFFIVSPKNLRHVIEIIKNNRNCVEKIRLAVNHNIGRIFKNIFQSNVFILDNPPKKLKTRFSKLKRFVLTCSDFSDVNLLHQHFDFSKFNHIIFEHYENRSFEWISVNIENNARSLFPQFGRRVKHTDPCNFFKIRLKLYDIGSFMTHLAVLVGGAFNILCICGLICFLMPIVFLYIIISQLFK